VGRQSMLKGRGAPRLCAGLMAVLIRQFT
jgi:hypothetical protein